MGFCKLCLATLPIHYPSTCQQCFGDPISHLPSISLTRIRALSEHLLNGASLKKLPQPACTSACKSDETAVATGWGVLKSWCPLSLEHIAYYSDVPVWQYISNGTFLTVVSYIGQLFTSGTIVLSVKKQECGGGGGLDFDPHVVTLV